MFGPYRRRAKSIAAALASVPVALAAQPATTVPATPYADLADLADSAPLVVRVQVRKLAPLAPAQVRGVRAGQGRFYAEAKTEALIAGSAPLGEAQRYLVDLPLDAKGKPPALKKKSVVLFARSVPGRPGELQLVSPDAQLLWDPALDGRLRTVLTELRTAPVPPKVTGVREAIHVPGNLAGEGETQLFLRTANEEPAAITVVHSPGAAPRWSVAFSEVLDQGGRPPTRDTLAWYRLACFLPRALPEGANVSATDEDRARAEADYRLVLDQLGTCGRLRR